MDDLEYTMDEGAQSEIAQIYYIVFNTEGGKKVLEHLRQRTEEKPTMPQAAGDGQSLAMMMALREGENNLYRYIKSVIKIGERKEEHERSSN